jgi:superfamily I DNA/RNA helicase
LPLGDSGVDDLHFFQLCGKITGKEIPYEKADTEYYDMVIQDTLEKLPGTSLKYDAILIDEGQDFSDDMLKIVVSLMNPITNQLAIALDENQNIYQKRRNWKELGIDVRGRMHQVTWIYRNTQEIANFAKTIVGNGAAASIATADKHGAKFPETFESPHGAPP